MHYSLGKIIKGWFSLCRPAFHAVGIAPFILGTVLAYKLAAALSLSVFFLGAAALILIVLATYHAGEYFDYREDEISQKYYRCKFAGGSGVIQRGIVPRRAALWSSIFSFALAGCIGLVLQFYFKTGPLTLLMGALGAFSGFFYSMRPVRLVERGFGEIFIGFCYGWLTIASAFYIQTAMIHPLIHWLAIPVGLSIFNVILLNEFPDYEADRATGKKNILYRTGKKNGVILYVILAVLASAAVFASTRLGVPFAVIFFYLPFFAVSLFIIFMLLRGKYEERKTLELLCGLNIAVNLGISLSFLLAYIK
ncbi:MAG TPA: prenyltransferase [Deltaproteobacteria bacterium]|nr:prenyltransferase [Deltaproteobacteria bacterium]